MLSINSNVIARVSDSPMETADGVVTDIVTMFGVTLYEVTIDGKRDWFSADDLIDTEELNAWYDDRAALAGDLADAKMELQSQQWDREFAAV